MYEGTVDSAANLVPGRLIQISIAEFSFEGALAARTDLSVQTNMSNNEMAAVLSNLVDFPDVPMPAPTWTTTTLPKVRDPFAGAPEHQSYTELRRELLLIQEKRDMLLKVAKALREKLVASKELGKRTMHELAHRRDINVAQTVFVLEHWNQHPDWTSAEAHMYMQQHVDRSFPAR